MAVQKQRTQILLEPTQHSALAEIARLEKRSVSDVVRSIVDQYLNSRSEDVQKRRARQALETCRQRRKIQARSGVYREICLPRSVPSVRRRWMVWSMRNSEDRR